MRAHRPVASTALLAALLAATLCTSPPAAGGDGDGKRPGREKPKDGGGRDGRDEGKGGKKDEGKAGEAAKPKPAEPTGPYRVGDAVQDVSVELLDGGSWSALSARGTVTVIVFGADWSKESLESLRLLGDATGPVAKSGAARLAILRDADAATAKKTVADAKITGTVGLDPKRKVYDRFARKGLPYTVVIDASGKVALSESGFDGNAVARRVEEILKGGAKK